MSTENQETSDCKKVLITLTQAEVLVNRLRRAYKKEGLSSLLICSSGSGTMSSIGTSRTMYSEVKGL